MKLKHFLLVVLFFTSLPAVSQDNSDYEEAYKTFEDGKIDEAYIFLKRSLNEQPDHLPSKILMAEVLGLSGLYDDSLLEFEESLQAGADPNLIIEPYIKVLLTLKQTDKVTRIKETLLTPNKLAFLLSAKALAYTQLGDIPQAELHHNRALSTSPNNIIILNTAAQYFLDANKLDRAKELLDIALSNETKAAETYQLYGKYYAKTGQTEKQINTLKKGLAVSENHPIILRDLVSAYTSTGNFASAKEAIELTLEQSPTDPMAKLLLSWVAAELNENELSKTTLDDLVNSLSQIDSDDLSQRDGMLLVSAMANFAATNIELAKGQFEQYLSRNPNHFSAAKLLVEVYRQDRNYLAAANLLEKFNSALTTDVTLVATLCDLYIQAKLNHKCDGLLINTRKQFSNDLVYIQTQAKLFEARGKLDLALQSLEKLPNNDLGATIQRAVISIRNNEFDKAKTFIDQLMETDASNLDFLNLRASLLKQQGNDTAAIEIYESILAQDRLHYSANFNLAAIYYAQNTLQSARRITTSLLESRPNDLSLLILHARILTRLGESESALETLLLADAAHRESKALNEAFVDLFMTTQDYAQAKLYVSKLLKNDLTDPSLMRLKARVDDALGDTDEAIKGLRALYGVIANDFDQVYQLSLLQRRYGDNEGALRSLKKAEELSPNNFFVKRDLGRMGFIQNDISLAQASLDWLNKQSPTNPDVILLNADMLMLNQNKSGAALRYHNAVRQANGLGPALIGSYQLAIEGVESQAFIELFEGLAKAPKINTFATHLLADFYYTNKAFDTAKNHYISISNAQSYSALPMVLNNLANIYIMEEKYDAASNFAVQAHQITQTNPYVLSTLGWINTLQGKYEDGLDFLRRAYSMNAQEPNLRYYIAYTLHKLGRTSESKRELSILLSDFNEFEKRKVALELQAAIR